MKSLKNIKAGLLNGTLALAISAIMVKILGVIYKVPLSYILTDEGMGYFNTAYTIYGFFYVICTAGIPKAITCVIREQMSTGNENEAYYIYKKSLFLFIPLTTGVTLLYILLAPVLSHAIGNEKALITMLVIGPSILFTTVGGVARGYLNARLRLMPIAISQLIEAVMKLALGLLFAGIGKALGFSLSYLSGFTVLGITIGSVFSAIYLCVCSKRKNMEHNTGQNLDIKTNQLFKRIVRIAIPITVSSSILSLGGIIDMAVIMRQLTDKGITEQAANSLYGNYTTLSVPMMNLVISVLTPLSVAMLPKLITYRVRGNNGLFNDELKGTLRLTAFLAAPCSFIYYFYSFDVLDVLFSPSASAIGAQTLAALSVAIYFLSILTVLNTAHEAIGNLRIPILSVLLGAIVKLAVGFVLIRYFDFGILSAPVGTVISNIVGCLISVVALEINRIRIPYLTLAAPVFIAVISYGLPYKFLYSVGILNSSVFDFILLIALSTLIYLTLYFLLLKLPKLARKSKNQQKLFSNSHV